MDSDSASEGRRLLQQLEHRTSSGAPQVSLRSPSKLPLKVEILREVSLHRAVDLMRTGLSCYEEAANVPAVILTRALLESAAVVFAAQKVVWDTCEAGTLDGGADKQIVQLLFGGRALEAADNAINALTLLNKLDKRCSGIRRWYDQLSEVAHPNYVGLLGSYADIDQSELHASFGPTKIYQDIGPNFGFPALLSGAELILTFNDGIVTLLPRFSRICHETNRPDEV